MFCCVKITFQLVTGNMYCSFLGLYCTLPLLNLRQPLLYLKSIIFDFLTLCLKLSSFSFLWRVLKGWYEYVGTQEKTCCCCKLQQSCLGLEFVLFTYSLQWTAWSRQQDLCLCRSKSMCGRGPKTSTSFFWILSSPLLIPASLIRGKLRWRKPCMSVLHSLLFLLCVCLSPPLCVLCRPSELCVHFGPSVTTSQASWPLLFLTSTWNILPNHGSLVWPFIYPSRGLLPLRSWSFRAKS